MMPVTSVPIEHGVLVVEGGRIAAVGGPNTPIPAGATVVRCDGRTIIPGIVDTHSHIGGGGGGDESNPIQPDARIYDSIDPLNPGFRRARSGGVTTLNIMPGSGHLMSGQTLYVKNRGAKTIDGLTIRAADGWIMGGMKMANGTNPLGSPPFPGTRAKSMALVREHFLKALEYKKKKEEGKLEAIDLGMEAMVEVLNGRRIVHNHTHRADDIMSVLRLQKEFGYRLVLQHVSEAWKVADEIAAAKVPASLIVLDAPGGKLEAAEIDMRNAMELNKRGAAFAFHSDDGIIDCRLLRRSACLAIRNGLPRDAALRALTLSGAEMLDLGDRIGSLDVGKDADFVVMSGDPFSTYTQVLETWVEGRKVFDLSDPQDRLVAVGGYGAAREERPYLCCGGDH